MTNSKNKTTLSCQADGTTTSITFNSDSSLQEYVDNFKKFLLACGFDAKNVSDIRCSDDDMFIVKERIKLALELLESLQNRDDKISAVIKYLDEAYDC